MSVVAIVLRVAEADSSVTARLPHLLNKSSHQDAEDDSIVSLKTNLGRRFVACGEGWAHQRLLPPAGRLVLKIVICFRAKHPPSKYLRETL